MTTLITMKGSFKETLVFIGLPLRNLLLKINLLFCPHCSLGVTVDFVALKSQCLPQLCLGKQQGFRETKFICFPRYQLLSVYCYLSGY